MANGTLVSFLTSGLPYAKDGYIKSYAAGTTSPKALYTDRAMEAPCTLISDPEGPLDNAIALDSCGCLQCYGDGLYKFAVLNSAGITVKTLDDIGLGV